MIKIKIICNDCKRKTTILTKVNFEEESYFCCVCGSANTKIEEVK
jgi:hypothetical protein